MARLTVLHRPDGTWSKEEMVAFNMKFGVDIAIDPNEPENLALVGNINEADIVAFAQAKEIYDFSIRHTNGQLVEKPSDS